MTESQMPPFPKVGDKFCNACPHFHNAWSAHVVGLFEDDRGKHFVFRVWWRRRRYYKYGVMSESGWHHTWKWEIERAESKIPGTTPYVSRLRLGPLPKEISNKASGFPQTF